MSSPPKKKKKKLGVECNTGNYHFENFGSRHEVSNLQEESRDIRTYVAVICARFYSNGEFEGICCFLHRRRLE